MGPWAMGPGRLWFFSAMRPACYGAGTTCIAVNGKV